MCHIPAAQTPQVPLVELYTDNQGLYFPAGRTLYAVIFDDGRLEYMDTTNHDLVVKHRVLTAAELIALRQRLESKAILPFTGIINAEHQPQRSDYQTNLEVSIRRDHTRQRFVMRGYDAEDARPFPQVLNALLYVVDDFKHVQYRLSSNCRVPQVSLLRPGKPRTQAHLGSRSRASSHLNRRSYVVHDADAHGSHHRTHPDPMALRLRRLCSDTGRCLEGQDSKLNFCTEPVHGLPIAIAPAEC
jgi:hypothetical protein